MSYHYHFVVASQDFLIKEEPIEEILRERKNYYKSISKEIDFWFILDPHFIDNAIFDDNYVKLPKRCAAIVSLDKQFIQWLKLRIVFVAVGTFQSSNLISC